MIENKGAPANAMDVHNNAISLQISSNANPVTTIKTYVATTVNRGCTNAKSGDQITFPSTADWHESLLW